MLLLWRDGMRAFFSVLMEIPFLTSMKVHEDDLLLRHLELLNYEDFLFSLRWRAFLLIAYEAIVGAGVAPFFTEARPNVPPFSAVVASIPPFFLLRVSTTPTW